MKVYLVSSGSYSDYHIVAACTTKEAADERARVEYDSDVLEMELDEPAGYPPGLLPFYVIMDIDGDARSMRDTPFENYPAEGYHVSHAGISARQFKVWATDEEHAVKIVNERRLMLIANGSWK